MKYPLVAKVSGMTYGLSNEAHRVLLTKNKAKFTKSFRQNFEYVKCYHGTRLDDYEIKSVRKNGLVFPTKQLITEKAKRRFQNDSDLQLDSRIEYFLEQYPLSKGVYVNLNINEFSASSSQYLQYGSESLLPIADALSIEQGGDFRRKLIQFGKPCIVEIDIPSVDIPDNELLRIYEHVFNFWRECALFFKHSIKSSYIKHINILN